jgi:hypothetical protein
MEGLTALHALYVRQEAMTGTEWPTIFIVLAGFALSGCQTTDSAVHRTNGSNPLNELLRDDQTHLKIQAPGELVHFAIPSGWHIGSQAGPRAYTLTHAGTFGYLPFLRVSLETGLRAGLSEESSHQERLSDIHTNFYSAYRRRAGTLELTDGRRVAIEEYVDGDGAELAAFIPENGYVTEVFLTCSTAEELIQERPALEELIRSYYVK